MLIRELRAKAALCRRAAIISTTGAGKTNHILLELAEQLEREVALAKQRGKQVERDFRALVGQSAPCHGR
jgi:hypothetical protein